MQARATRVRARKPIDLDREWARQMKAKQARRVFSPETPQDWRFCRLMLVEEKLLLEEDKDKPSRQWTPIGLLDRKLLGIEEKTFDDEVVGEALRNVEVNHLAVSILKLAALRMYVRERVEHVRDAGLDVDAVLADIAEETAECKARLIGRGVTQTLLPLILRHHASRLPRAEEILDLIREVRQARAESGS